MRSFNFDKFDYSKIPIPKKIHYIWLGKEIPYPYLQAILEVVKVAQESHFEVMLWTNDEKIIHKTLEKNSELDAGMRKKKVAGIHIRNIEELFIRMKDD